MLFIAQIGGSGDASSVARLPDLPLLAHYLLENPWPVAIGGATVGVVVMLLARRHGRHAMGTRMLFVGFAVSCAALILGYLVTTEREVLRQRTRELADCVATARTIDLRELLTEQARVASFSPVYAGTRGRDQVLQAVQSKIAEFGPLESHEIGPVQAIVDGATVARTQARVWVRPRKDLQFIGAPTGIWLRIDWRREAATDPWRAGAITLMQIDGLGINSELARE